MLLTQEIRCPKLRELLQQSFSCSNVKTTYDKSGILKSRPGSTTLTLTILEHHLLSTVYTPASTADILEELERSHKIYAAQLTVWQVLARPYTSLNLWINATVDPKLLDPLMTRLRDQQGSTIQQVVRELRTLLAPTRSTNFLLARRQYKALLEQARNGRVSPEKWYNDWLQAYSQATEHKIGEIIEPSATLDFLEAISVRMAPDWGKQTLNDATIAFELDKPINSLYEIARAFSVVSRAPITPSGAYTVMAPERDDGYHPCPCKRPERRHPWAPIECYNLLEAITGTTNKGRSPMRMDHRKSILMELQKPEFKDLRAIIKEKGLKIPTIRKSDIPESESSKQGNDQYRASYNAAIIAPWLDESLGVFTVIGRNRHPLSDSTLLDNCGAVHIVNRKDLLEPGTMSYPRESEYVQSGNDELSDRCNWKARYTQRSTWTERPKVC